VFGTAAVWNENCTKSCCSVVADRRAIGVETLRRRVRSAEPFTHLWYTTGFS